jgi:hypothetical protein
MSDLYQDEDSEWNSWAGCAINLFLLIFGVVGFGLLALYLYSFVMSSCDTGLITAAAVCGVPQSPLPVEIQKLAPPTQIILLRLLF